MFEMYQDNYILPYYYTVNPYYSVYNSLQDNTTIKNDEFKMNLSFLSSIYKWDKLSIIGTYSVKLFWQLYTQRPWFRSTDYNPQLFLSYELLNGFKFDVGIDHESNGRGDDLERSWNRIYPKFNYKDSNFLFEFMPWIPLKNEAVEYQNDKIEDYLGYERITLGYKISYFETKISIQNVENISKIQINFSEAIKFSNKYAIYFQYFYGYGQSLLEYNHFTQGVGIGIKFLEDFSKFDCESDKNLK